MSFRDYVVHAVAVLTMVGVTASARHVSPSEQTDIIVYEHAPDAIAPWPVLDVYLLDTEGRKPRALTTDGHSHTPSWSPMDSAFSSFMTTLYMPRRVKPPILSPIIPLSSMS